MLFPKDEITLKIGNKNYILKQNENEEAKS